MRKITLTLAVVIPFCALLAVFVYNLPPVYERVGTLRAELKYRLNPPEEAVFVPQEQAPLDLPTPTPSHTPPPPTPTNPGPADTPVPSPTPDPDAAPLA
jgi:hypothetical protein